MSFSANEIASLAQKAARGAGFPPRQAEVFGAATVHHLAGGGAPTALLHALADPTDSPILRLPLLAEDILRALTLSGPEITLTLQPGDEALALAYTALMHIHIERAAVDQPEGAPPRLVLCADLDTSSRARLPARIDAPADLIEHLSGLAAKTHVAATGESRDAGAGAGNIDND
ncbi:DUF3726 domain-containing protein [Antarctobacter heliothermus]|uniref:Uncharacterized protein n=1 Tax=Antarctobacter heliothermus TaxID=74033 RepID=A0A239J2X8_9RHOB|nr:DUF3726 domain-containing protein [Antarctobacter heliothermus]SNT00032.1 Protein of unknown function [Antarctobacter heliothermus]